MNNNLYLEYFNFDHNKYMNDNNDLKEVLSRRTINKKSMREKLWRHWCIFGRNEKRNYPRIDIQQEISIEYFENNYIIFIIRKIIDNNTSKYWRLNYEKIRKYYKSIKIVIIDDNSNKEYIKYDDIKDIEYIYTEHHNVGELLPYYYYFKNNRERKYALIIHDSLFLEGEIHKCIKEKDFTSLWHFLPETEIQTNRINIEKILQNNKDKDLLMNTFNSGDWRGIFGCMSIISHNLLITMNNSFDIFNSLISKIKDRNDRKAFERILSLYLRCMNIDTSSSLLGNIHHWCKLHYGVFWDIELYEYNKSTAKDECLLTKIWTGR